MAVDGVGEGGRCGWSRATSEELTVTAMPATAMPCPPVAPAARVDPSLLDDQAVALDALVAVLAASCSRRLAIVAARGGPSPDEHLDELRRLLVRREGRRVGLTRRRQLRHALDAARTGRPGAIAAADRHALARDLRELDRALTSVTR
jgi:hypothetical protein